MPRLVKPAPPPFDAEQVAWIECRIREVEERVRAERAGTWEAIYRACVGVARALKPEKPWDALRERE